MTNLRESQIPLIKAEFGPPGRSAVGFQAIRLNTATAASEHPAIRTGANVDRTGRAGLFAFVLDSLAGGFRPLSTIGSYGFDKTTVWKNEGVMVHIPGMVSLPYLLTSQTSVISGDFTGYNAANRRVHSVNWAASDGLRFIAGVGPFIIKDTSVSSAALTVPSVSDAVTDDILSMWTGPFGSNANVLIIGTDGQTDDTKYTTDPTANTISWTSLITHSNAADAVWGGAWMPQLGSGWHVVMARLDNEPGWYAFRPSDTAPLTNASGSATIAPVVWADTKDVIGGLPTTNTGAISPTIGSFVPGSGETGPISLLEAQVTGSNEVGSTGTFTSVTERAIVISSRWTPWSGASNIVTSNDTRATSTFTHAHVEVTAGGAGDASPSTSAADGPVLISTDLLVATEYPFSAIPLSAEGVGYVVAVERLEADAANDITIQRVQLFLDGNPIGENRADGAEVPTVEASASYGATTDTWGVKLTGEQLRRLGVCVQFQSDDTENHTGTVSVDHITLTIYYKVRGTLVEPTDGGFTIGPMPSNPNVLPTVEPLTANASGIATQRILKLNHFAYDIDGDRPVMEAVEQPPVGMGYVGIIAHFQGGVVAIGGNNSSAFNECKLVDSEGIVRNLNMPKTHAGVAITAVKAVAQGNALLVWVANLDGTDAQLWMFFDGVWSALGPLQSKSSSITQKPLYWAETVNGLEQSQGYLLIPNSTTSLMGTRQFIAPGLFDDPHITNTTQLKHDGPLAVTLPILDMGTIETKKALLTLQAQSYRLDDDTLYGTAQIEIDTTGDLTFADPAVDMTFGTKTGNTAPFVDYNVVEAANKPGVSMPTAAIRLTLDNATGTAKSPQPLPIVFWLTGVWPYDDTESFFLPSGQRNGTNVRDIYERVKDLAETKPSQRLAWEGLDGSNLVASAAFLGARFGQTVKIVTLESGKPVTREYAGTTLDFRLLPGAVSSS